MRARRRGLSAVWIALAGASAALVALNPGGAGPEAAQSAGVLPTPAFASTYPLRPIEIIAPSGPGRGWDLLARAAARTLSDERLVPVPITIRNTPGGIGAVVFANMVTRRRGDAYTLAVMGSPLTGTLARRVVPYAYRDVTPIAIIAGDPYVLAARRGSAFNWLPTLLEVLKRDPGVVTFGGGAPAGSLPHLAIASLASQHGIPATKIHYVPFPDTALAQAAVQSGTATILAASLSEIRSSIESGQLSALAILGPERAGGLVRGIPTAREQGVNFSFLNWRGLYMPPDVSPEAGRFWEEALTRMVKSRLWVRELDENRWMSFVLTGDRLRRFLEDDLLGTERVLQELGLVR